VASSKASSFCLFVSVVCNQQKYSVICLSGFCHQIEEILK